MINVQIIVIAIVSIIGMIGLVMVFIGYTFWAEKSGKVPPDMSWRDNTSLRFQGQTYLIVLILPLLLAGLTYYAVLMLINKEAAYVAAGIAFLGGAVLTWIAMRILLRD